MKTIEFSGVDGSGKTTAMTVFCDELERLGARVLRTREVGSPHVPVCAKLRELILNPEVKMDGKAMELVFAAMRVENQRHYESVADKHDFCVSDRGWLCHLSYTDHNVGEWFTDLLYRELMHEITTYPDLIYLFEVDHAEAGARIAGRDKPTDAIEAKGADFQLLVAGSYRRHAAELRSRGIEGVSVDSGRPKVEVAAEMRQRAVQWMEIL